MKKVLAVILMALAVTALFVSCDDPKHEHSYDAAKWEKDDTSHWHVCTTCSEKVEVATHTLETTGAKEPTCTESGWDEYESCSICGYSTKKEKTATGHNYADPVVEEGKAVQKCKICSNEKTVTDATVKVSSLEALQTASKAEGVKTIEVEKSIAVTETTELDLKGKLITLADNASISMTGDGVTITIKNFSSDQSEWVDISGAQAILGGKAECVYYPSFAKAINEAKANSTITLVADAEVDERINIEKSVTVDMAGHNISAKSTSETNTEGNPLYVFNINKSGVTFELKNSSENEAVVNDKGTGYTRGINIGTKLNNVKTVIGKNVKINTGEGVIVFSGELDVYGKIDVTKREFAISGNGSKEYEADDPGTVINLYKGAEVKSTALVDSKNGCAAIYLPQKGTVNINGATVEGYAGIVIRSGVLNITDGAVIKGIQNDQGVSDRTSGSGGARFDGSAIVVISNNAYYSKMNITITDSTLESMYSTAIREAKETSDSSATYTKIESLKINGNSIIKSGSGVTSDLILKDKSKVDITGGTFSKSPSDYLKTVYTAESTNDGYVVKAANAAE